MAWEEPKTDWTAGDVVSKDDFNRIEGNIQELENTKETSAGAQAKANTAETNAKAYTDTHEAKSASISAKGHVQLSDSVSSTSISLAATANAVKKAYDKADEKMDKSGGEFTGITKAHSNTSYTTKQIRNIILSPDNANVSLMADGDIWMKYK